MPATAEAIAKVDEQYLDSNFRLLVDCSSLGTKSSQENQAVVSRAPTELPSVAETLSRICDNCVSSGLDLKTAFFQVLLTKRARRLFAFESAMPEAVVVQLRILVMGQSCSPRLCSFIFRSCLDIISSFNLNLNFDEFVRKLEAPRSNDAIPDPRLTFSLSLTSYLDDLLLQSPKAKAQGQYDLNKDSYWKPPKNDEEKSIFLHLMLLRKCLRTLKYNNLLISLSKATILSQNHFSFMGYLHERTGMKLLPDTIKTIQSISRPSNMRAAMRLLGLANYFSCLVKNLRPLCTFLSNKLRKNQTYTWLPEDDESLEKLKQALIDGHVSGFRWLTGTGTGANILLILQSDWCHSTNSSCAVLLVKGVGEDGKVAIKPALYYSKHLPESYRGKSSLLGECASLIQALCAMKAVIAGRCLRVYSDSCSLVAVMNRRLSAKVCSDCPMMRRLVSMSIQFPFDIRFLPGQSNSAADFISRYEHERGKPLKFVLDSGDMYADFKAIDECLFRDVTKETLAEFMERSKKNEKLLIQLEENIGNDDSEIRQIYSKSHVFATLAEEMEYVLEVGTETDENPSVTYFQTKQPTIDELGITEDTFHQARVQTVIDESAECFTPADQQRDCSLEDSEDQLGWAIAPLNTSAQTAESLRRSRQDSAFMVEHETLRNALLNPIDGLIPDTIDSSGQYLADFRREVCYMVAVLRLKKVPIGEVNIFDSYESLMAALPRARLSDDAKAKHKFYKEIQNREINLSTMINLLQGRVSADSYDVDILRRTDRLFKALFLDMKSLVIIEGLLFKVKWPREHESAVVVLVVNENDARRQLSRYHSIYCHRGVLFLYAVASQKIYTVGLMSLCMDVVKKCSFCAQYYSKKRLGPQIFPNFMADTSLSGAGFASIVFCDVKGPLASGDGTKGYVLVTVCLISNFVTFHFLPDSRAETLAKTLFEKYIVPYSFIRSFASDWGGNYIGKVTRELFHLCGTKVRLVSSRHPRSNHSERSVHLFSKALNSLLIGKSLARWKEILPLVAFYVNSSYSSSFLGQSPFEVNGYGRFSAYFNPLVIIKDADTSHLEPIWQRKISLMRQIAEAMRKHYKAYLSVARPKLHTCESLGITEGSRIYFKVYEYSNRLAYFSSLLPKFQSGQVTKIISRTSVLVRNDATGKIVSRHLTDVFPMRPAPLYGNTYENPLDARIAEEIETERDVVDIDVDPEKAGMEFQAAAKTAANEELTDPTNLKAPEDAQKEKGQEVDTGKKAENGEKRRSRRLRKEEPENPGL